MKRAMICSLLALAALVSCRGQQHPIEVYVDPRFTDADNAENVEKIAVLNCATSLHSTEDPDNVAPATVEKFLVPALDLRTDYKFIAPNTVEYAVGQNGWDERYQKFLRSFAVSGKPDLAFITDLAHQLQCDGFLIPVVDLWQKDEADITENTTPATYVGATITILSARDGVALFRAIDEDYEEGARTETGDRSLVTSGSGAVYADLGRKVHRAPPFEDVASKVARALANSLPAR
ncbi:MAG: hypothetical protein OEX18_08575 [Candidatus Krumholzibacteria bacterium]|nr:hypothetical protein [Candidatus Krumholzibacteria bacterium]MDH4337314.1 hypothetical protein [Candidatus Krumholzibacteria bacterium]MDH5269973.1 hypothetical protein [Candidatus Krumholzibacteria bacterium]